VRGRPAGTAPAQDQRGIAAAEVRPADRRDVGRRRGGDASSRWSPTPADGLEADQAVPFQRSMSGTTSPLVLTVKPTATASVAEIAATPVRRDLPAAAAGMFPPVHAAPSQRTTSGSSFPLASTE
jgi:hypothetical protein